MTSTSYPDKTVCDESVEQGAVIQYVDRADGYKECHVIGRYDASNDDLMFNLLSERNPALGVSMTYPLGAVAVEFIAMLARSHSCWSVIIQGSLVQVELFDLQLLM